MLHQPMFAVDNLSDLMVIGTVITVVNGLYLAGVTAIVKLMWGYIKEQHSEFQLALARKDKEHADELDRLGFRRQKGQI